MSLYSSTVLADNPGAYYELNEPPYTGAYADSGPFVRDSSLFVTPESVGVGRGSWSPLSRVATTGIRTYPPLGVTGLSIEFLFKLDTPGRYILADVASTTTDPEVRLEISEDVDNVGDYLIKFGLGVGTWDIDLSDTHQHAFVYSDESSDLFDNDWHHIVVTWTGTSGFVWDASQLAIFVDGVRRDQGATRSTYTGSNSYAPLNFANAIYVGGPSTGENDHVSTIDEIAIYETLLTPIKVVKHYNATATIEAVREIESAPSFITFTDGILQTTYEQNFVGNFSYPAFAVSIEAVSSVSIAFATNDMIASREVLETEGAAGVSTAGGSLETGEPNAAGYTATSWYEISFDPEDMLEARLQLTSPTSTGKISVYKQPSLDDGEDFDEEEGEDATNVNPLDSEPDFSKMVLVATASNDQKITLDPEYGSAYFIQVGRLTGPGDDFTISWGDADPGEGGSFAEPIEIADIGGSDTISTLNAWLEVGEPNTTGITESRSVWYLWTAPAIVDAATVFTVTGGSDLSFGAEVYSGTALGALSQQASVVATAPTNSVQLSFTATPSAKYYLRIASVAPVTTFTVQWGEPIESFEAADPVENLLVTVHAGVKGGTWAGKTYAANEKITELPNRYNVQFQEALNIPGSGTVTVKCDDPVMRAYGPSDWPNKTSGPWTGDIENMFAEDPYQLLQFGNIIKFWMNDKCVSAFVVKSRENSLVGTGEEADRAITVSGPTVHFLLNDFLVMHDNYPDTRNIEMRSFNWASNVGKGENWNANGGGGWFDSTGNFLTNKSSWNHPINVNSIQNPPGYLKKRTEPAKKRPKYALFLAKKPKWPDKSARWMWISQNKAYNTQSNFPRKGQKLKGLHYYRTKTFNVPKAGGRYRFSVHSDTYYEVWLDGDVFLVGNGNENYVKFKTKTINLARTTDTRKHTVAVFVQDRTTKDKDHNDAFIMTVQQVNTKGKAIRTVLRSNSTSWFAWHGATPPSWSRAMVFRTLFVEAQERGNHSALAMHLRSTFGQKSEEGYVWADTKKFSTQIQVGTSMLDLQQQFSESLKFDVYVDPDTLEIKAWQGGKNGSSGRGKNVSYNVALVPGRNLINYTVSEADNSVNMLLARYASGYVPVKADAESANYRSIQKLGLKEGYVEFGGLHDPVSTRKLAQALLTALGDTTRFSGSGDIVGHSTETYAGSVVPVKGAVPFLDWNVGDTISAPNTNGALRPHRVLSISCTEDAEGNLTFDPELQGA